MSQRSFAAAAAIVLGACGTDLGALALPEETPPPAIIDVRVVVGRTDGPGADQQLLHDTAAVVATRSVGAPGSRIRAYDVDCPPALVFDETVGDLPARPRARERHVEREGARLTERITSALASTPARRRGRCIAAQTAEPDEPPTSRASWRMSWRAVRKLSLSFDLTQRWTSERSSTSGMKS